jgi:hypothetical protein
MGKKITKYYFSVQGGSQYPYNIELTLAPLTISCTCTAAYTNQPCKHRIAILKGENPGFVDEVPENYIEILEVAKQEAETIGVFNALNAYQEMKLERQALAKTTEQEFKKYKEALIMQKGGNVVKKAFDKMNEAIIAEIPVHVQLEAVLAELQKVFVKYNADIKELSKIALQNDMRRRN